ncbi:LAFE_0H14906g1_1 [Lachancea fermentati]|uniref:LAFE_0H14906g1_1 n=1 Tax=Lachancea fermentati TaxID=4955 RepID=A0A1G4ML31_LACFM|nr:LAFE_0H14906g1_1 [Lachancea fermentati]
MTIEQDPVQYLKSISSVRDTTSQVYNYAKSKGEGNYFTLDLSKMPAVVDFLCGIIGRDYQTNYSSIPPHGRWQHLNCGGEQRVESLIAQWRGSGVDEIEIARKLIDLFVFSVLIDAGAGNVWKYTSPDSSRVGRSEGLAVASYYLFIEGALSADKQDPYKVNGQKLKELTMDQFVKGFQISDTNPMSGAEGRLNLIQRLGVALVSNSEIFGPEGRPGGIVDYLYGKSTEQDGTYVVDLNDVWNALMDGLTSIWPMGRTTVEGKPLGDAWRLDTKADVSAAAGAANSEISDIVTFHKLTQWLCYSLLVPLEQFGYKFTIKHKDLQTGLPEYRNGGLFYDFGVLQLKPEALKRGLALSNKLGTVSANIPSFEPHDGAIVEWRCMTIGLLDDLLPLVNEKLQYQLSLPQLIEAGSWKAGREIAAQMRPETNGPPIELFSDGTVF